MATMWRFAVLSLHALGREATATEIADALPLLSITPAQAGNGIRQAIDIGLAVRVRTTGYKPLRTYRLTPLGEEYVAGRITQHEKRPGGRYWCATWLRSLPADINMKEHVMSRTCNGVLEKPATSGSATTTYTLCDAVGLYYFCAPNRTRGHYFCPSCYQTEVARHSTPDPKPQQENEDEPRTD